jgi:hypothetical protein
MIDYVLNTSLERQCLITIVYQKGEEITRRNIKVLEIDGNNIKAYCYLRHQNRLFKKENIMAADLCRDY